MHVAEFLVILIINFIVIFILYYLQKRLIEKSITHLKKEIQELEDLVAAIIEEFEDIADTGADVSKPAATFSPKDEPELNYPPAVDFLVNTEADNFNGSIHQDTPLNQPADTINNSPVNRSADHQESNKASWGEFQSGSKPETLFKPELINDPKHRRILELRQKGITVEEIARQLGTGRGEIQLVLGIYRRS